MPAPVKSFEKDPDSTLDYTLDWATTWLVSGDALDTSTWSVSDGSRGDTSLSITTDSQTTGKATVWLAGGVHGESYLATNSIVTTAGRIADRSIAIIVRSQ